MNARFPNPFLTTFLFRTSSPKTRFQRRNSRSSPLDGCFLCSALLCSARHVASFLPASRFCRVLPPCDSAHTHTPLRAYSTRSDGATNFQQSHRPTGYFRPAELVS